MIQSSVARIVAGTLIAALVGYAILTYLKPLRGKGVGLALMALVALWAIKTVALLWLPGYHPDVAQFMRWALRIAGLAPAHFYGPGYAYSFDYPPGGIYILWPLHRARAPAFIGTPPYRGRDSPAGRGFPYRTDDFCVFAARWAITGNRVGGNAAGRAESGASV